MTLLVLGMALFLAVHLISLSPARAPIVAKLGEKPYKGAFSLVSLLGLALMIWGFRQSVSGPGAFPVYDPPYELRKLTHVLVFLAMVLLASAHMKGHIRKIVKHPMSLGIALWALGHIIANDKASELILFGGFLALAVLDMIVSTVRGKLPGYQPHFKYDIFAIVGGVVVYAIVLFAHQWLFGVSPFS